MANKKFGGDRGMEETDSRLHNKIVEYVNWVKSAYFDHADFQKYIHRVEELKALVDQEWAGDKTTRFGLISSLSRGAYDNYVDTLTDLFDVDDLIVLRSDQKKHEQMAANMTAYINRLLRRVNYAEHLNRRCAFVPDYGWSIAYDSYRFNEGFVTKVNKTAAAGLETLKFNPAWDVYMDRPDMEVVNPEHWFGSPEHSYDLPYQGNIKRWYLKDVMRALRKKNAEGKPLYNKAVLEKLKDAMVRGQSDQDRHYKPGEPESSVQWGEDKQQPYVDVIRYNGPLNNINDPGLANDSNEYFIECTRDSLLLWIENPLDRKTMFTHGRTHPHRNRPWGRSFLDMMKPHHKFTDFLMNSSMEVVTDNLVKQMAVWEDDLLDPDDFYFPKGMNSFVLMNKNGKPPEVIGNNRSPAFQDIKEVLNFLDRDRQRGGASDQEMGALGESQDQTATAARILASAGSKKIRAGVKRLSQSAIIPQVRNLVMLSLVHGKPENRRFLSGDNEVVVDEELVKWFLTEDASMDLNDTITRDMNEEALKASAFFSGAVQILPNLAQPGPAIKMLRYQAELHGIPKRVIDDVLPIPTPQELGMPQMPGMPGQAPGASGQGQPAMPEMPVPAMPEEGMGDAAMAPPV